MKTVQYIVAGGKQIPCAVPVANWAAHGMTFPGLKPRKKTELLVTHWTGAENPAESMFRTLRGGGLSVHFFIGHLGDVWQFNDCDAFAAHAKGMNDRSVGIEIQNRADDQKISRGIERGLVKENIHGKDFVYTLFTPAQVHSALSVCMSVCEAYGIPWRVPMANGDVIPRQLTDAEYTAFSGICGHFHRTPIGKRDAGLALLRAIAAFEPRSKLGPTGPAQ